MRLLGGMNDAEGRVEVCSGEVWGSVCHDYWGSLDAQVVCRQLGYATDGLLILVFLAVVRTCWLPL